MRLSEREFAEQVLFGGTLADKLVAPDEVVADAAPSGAIGDVEAPGRPRGLELGRKSAPFPRLEAMGDPGERGRVLHFFANHELLALELMALALLRFPAAPPAFRRGTLRTMGEEQGHLRLYLARMGELGVAFGDLAVSEFFWRAMKGMRSPVDYVAGMALTFEQANLDFSRRFQEVFANAGDQASAAIMERVYLEEIGHVKHGLVWFERWRDPGVDLWTAYAAALRLPLSPARAKAKPFDREGREAAGLAPDFIRQLSLFGGSKGRPPAVLWFNPEVEIEVGRALAGGGGRAWGSSPEGGGGGVGDLRHGEALLTFLASEGDVLLCRRRPGLKAQEAWQSLGVPLPEYRECEDPHEAILALSKERALGPLRPWGFGPREAALAATLAGERLDKTLVGGQLAKRYAKTGLPAARAEIRGTTGALGKVLGPPLMDGFAVRDLAELREYAREVAKTLKRPVIVKGPYSAAGRERLVIDLAGGFARGFAGGFAGGEGELADGVVGWLEKGWRQWGALLAEPYVEVVLDGSWLGDLAESRLAVAPSLFQCDRQGRYLGHWLLPPEISAWPEAARRVLEGMSGGAERDSVVRDLAAVATEALQRLGAHGHGGRAGVDFHAYRIPALGERVFLQPLGEVNARTTMGHVALALGRFLAPGVGGFWRFLRPQDVGDDVGDGDVGAVGDGGADESGGGEALKRWAESAIRQHPLSLRRGKAVGGFVFTNDPDAAPSFLGVAAIGEGAMAWLKGV